ncbi:hypothetical protein [Streptomyces sp. NBC_00557]|uniref:hypothetical protein n=1 Tax=Streptomyces sp. NBC_00557 TaxID=2975776 RepID=UPI002E812180|nr:hypothetical protein [Streptomyces sp. NBC_00557]WUC33121.1 hypothetical protein OG956_02285 [Streptomyces sp. NBC_00557]
MPPTGGVLLTAAQLQWVPAAQNRPVMLFVLVFVVPLELVSGLLAFLARDGGAAAPCPCWAARGPATPSAWASPARSRTTGATELVIVDDTGHTTGAPGMAQALVAATDRYAARR